MTQYELGIEQVFLVPSVMPILTREGCRRMSYDLDITGERFVPWWQDYVIAYEHVHRYAFSVSHARGKRVLDLACGEGYGASLLAQTAHWVVGADIEATTLAHASVHHACSNIRYLKMNADHWPFLPASFDLIVSFETIEHLRSQGAFLRSVKEAITGRGMLILSTPRADGTSGDASGHNPYHQHELEREELMGLLGEHFRHTRLLGQRFIASSVIASSQGEWFIGSEERLTPLPTEIDGTNLDYPLASQSELQPKYYVALCSDAALPTTSGSLLIDNQDAALRAFRRYRQDWGELRQRCVSLEAQVEELSAQFSRAQRDLAASAALTAELRHRLVAALQQGRADPTMQRDRD
jgi:O-antigen biosynthesis protein